MAMGAPGKRVGGDDGPAGNTFDKYHTKNPIYRHLVREFLATVRAYTRRFERPAVLEVGCGEGHLARYLADGWQAPPIVAFDVSPAVIAEAARIGGTPRFFVGSSYALPFPDRSFDLVIMCEVMEHLAEPQAALAEISRVARRACLVSVPRAAVAHAQPGARLVLARLGQHPGARAVVVEAGHAAARLPLRGRVGRGGAGTPGGRSPHGDEYRRRRAGAT